MMVIVMIMLMVILITIIIRNTTIAGSPLVPRPPNAQLCPQVDMQQLLDEQMRKKLSKLEMAAGASRAQVHAQTNGSDSDSSCSGKTSPRKNSRLFSLLTTLKR